MFRFKMMPRTITDSYPKWKHKQMSTIHHIITHGLSSICHPKQAAAATVRKKSHHLFHSSAAWCLSWSSSEKKTLPNPAASILWVARAWLSRYRRVSIQNKRLLLSRSVGNWQLYSKQPNRTHSLRCFMARADVTPTVSFSFSTFSSKELRNSPKTTLTPARSLRKSC